MKRLIAAAIIACASTAMAETAEIYEDYANLLDEMNCKTLWAIRSDQVEAAPRVKGLMMGLVLGAAAVDSKDSPALTVGVAAIDALAATCSQITPERSVAEFLRRD